MRWLPKCKPKRFSFQYRGEVCLNCSHPLDVSDKFCPSCGQRNSTKKINLKDLIEELFSSFISYDSKLWKSLKLLFLKPGALPLAYVNGKRNQFTNPFRFFLSIAIIFFLVISLSINEEDFEGFNFMNKDSYAEEESNFENDTSIVADFKDMITDETNNLNDKRINKVEINSLIDSLQKRQGNKKSPVLDIDLKDNRTSALEKAFSNNQHLKYEEAVESEILEDRFLDWCLYRFYRGLTKTQQSIASFLNFVLAKTPFFIFFFVPLFSIGNLLLFIGSGKTYVDHMVFNFNLSSFLLIIFAFSLLIGLYWESGLLNLIFNLGIFYYTYKAIRNFYGNGRIASILKCILIAASYPISLFVFLLGLTALSFAFY